MDFAMLADRCAPDVAPQVLERLMKVESSFNPYAIGVVGGRLARQPRYKEEAIATAQHLERAGWNFSLGLGQVNRYNLDKYGLDYETVFDPVTTPAPPAIFLMNACGVLRQNFPRSRLSWQHFPATTAVTSGEDLSPRAMRRPATSTGSWR